MLWYIYPLWHRVSFTIIAEKHVEQLRKYFRLYVIDEKVFPNIYPQTNPLVVLHPFFYMMMRASNRVEYLLAKVKGIIGIDVADSDRISNLAVSMTHYAEAMIVPSKWARDAYIRSGCKTPVHVVWHGLDKEWYTAKPEIVSFGDLAELKKRKRLIYLTYFLWHSDWRKGADLVIKTYRKLRVERRDVVLVCKFMTKTGELHREVRRLGGIIVAGWLTEQQLRELLDISDIYLLFSRGGGFEINGLEAIARGVPVVAARGGAWEEYLPDFCLVDSKPSPYVLKDNPIHCGRGVEIIVEKVVDKILDIIDNLDDYRARVREHVQKNIKNKFTWEVVGRRLANIIRKYF